MPPRSLTGGALCLLKRCGFLQPLCAALRIRGADRLPRDLSRTGFCSPAANCAPPGESEPVDQFYKKHHSAENDEPDQKQRKNAFRFFLRRHMKLLSAPGREQSGARFVLCKSACPHQRGSKRESFQPDSRLPDPV